MRVLATVLKPVVASIYFSPETHESMHALGFGPTGGVVSGDPFQEEIWGAPRGAAA